MHFPLLLENLTKILEIKYGFLERLLMHTGIVAWWTWSLLWREGRTLINIDMVDDSHRLFYTIHFPLCQSERMYTNSMFVYLKFEMEAIQRNLIFTALNRVHPELFLKLLLTGVEPHSCSKEWTWYFEPCSCTGEASKWNHLEIKGQNLQQVLSAFEVAGWERWARSYSLVFVCLAGSLPGFQVENGCSLSPLL